MKSNNIIFSDLSTYTPKQTIAFYEEIFGWLFYDNNNYYTAYYDNNAIIGLYETPEKFKQLNMPHFWMTYIQVNNVEETILKAEELGGIIEMTDDIIGYGKVALIRDPLGAGFTIYEGNILQNTRTQNKPNTLIWHELHVSDPNIIIPFYSGIFDWKIEKIDQNTFRVYNNNNEHITDIEEISYAMKGKYEYWVSSFGVENLKATKLKILYKGGNLIFEESNRALFTDNSEQAFFYVTQI